MDTRLNTPVLGGVLLLILFLAFVRVGQASASSPPAEGWGVAYERAAVEYWGETATLCSQRTVSFESSVPSMYRLDQAEGQVLGRATIAEGPAVNCQMWIAPLQGRGIYFRCVLFAHEYGHWLGHADEPSDPRSSVASELLGEDTIDAPCHRLVTSVRSAH